MDAMIVVDMQLGLLAGPPKHDLHGVIARINQLAAMLRTRAGKIIWIRHCGRNDEFARGGPGWAFLPELDRQQTDLVVEKTCARDRRRERKPRAGHERREPEQFHGEATLRVGRRAYSP